MNSADWSSCLGFVFIKQPTLTFSFALRFPRPSLRGRRSDLSLYLNQLASSVEIARNLLLPSSGQELKVGITVTDIS